MSQISFNLFCLGDKRILLEFLRNEVDISHIINVCPNILAEYTATLGKTKLMFWLRARQQKKIVSVGRQNENNII